MAELTPIQRLSFVPLPGLSSPHLQTILSSLLPCGDPPVSDKVMVTLPDGDYLYSFVSIPEGWQKQDKTVVLLHGFGSDVDTDIMVRSSRKLFEQGHRIVRVNMRSAGLENAETERPYHGGVSSDLLEVVRHIKKETPETTLIIIGFSGGGNIALKLIGELGLEAKSLIGFTLAVCPPVDLNSSSSLLLDPSNSFYNNYYVKKFAKTGSKWTLGRTFDSLYEYDNIVTAPQWGFKDAADYYRQSSSYYVLPNIQTPCYMVFAEDDPIVDYSRALCQRLQPCVQVWLSKHGGHVGFLGWTQKRDSIFWLDEQLVSWVNQFRRVE